MRAKISLFANMQENADKSETWEFGAVFLGVEVAYRRWDAPEGVTALPVTLMVEVINEVQANIRAQLKRPFNIVELGDDYVILSDANAVSDMGLAAHPAVLTAIQAAQAARAKRENR